MEMPQPTQGHKMLEKLAGTWVGDEHMEPSQWCPEATVAQGHTAVRVALGGFAAVVDYEQKKDGQTTFSGHGVYTYSVQDDLFRLHWFDSMGTGPEVFSGQFDGDVLTMTSKGPMGHMRMTSDYSDPEKMGSRMEVSQDGEDWSLMFHGTYSRE